jgi:hypothetical protein
MLAGFGFMLRHHQRAQRARVALMATSNERPTASRECNRQRAEKCACNPDMVNMANATATAAVA